MRGSHVACSSAREFLGIRLSLGITIASATAGNTSHEGEVSAVAVHDLDDEHAMMKSPSPPTIDRAARPPLVLGRRGEPRLADAPEQQDGVVPGALPQPIVQPAEGRDRLGVPSPAQVVYDGSQTSRGEMSSRSSAVVSDLQSRISRQVVATAPRSVGERSLHA